MRTPEQIKAEVERVDRILRDAPLTKSRVSFPITREEFNALVEYLEDPRPGFESLFAVESISIDGVLLTVVD
jgi:hypothetical protein